MDFAFLETIKFGNDGLIPCVTQDAESGEVLMVAYMNRESLRETLARGLCAYWSRSRQRHWVKGETSGHTQEVREVRFDCDLDCVLIKVKQIGGACHTGYYSCFFQRLTSEGKLVEDGRRVFDPGKVYDKTP